MHTPTAQTDRSGQDQAPPSELSPELKALIDERVREQVDHLLAEPAPEPLWKVSDVATFLNVSKRTVENLIADGSIRPLWIRGARRFHPDAIRAYLRTTASNQP